MNSLSLLIYAVELVTNLNTIAFAGVILFAAGIALALGAWGLANDGTVSYKSPEERDENAKIARKWIKRFIVGLSVSIFLTVVVPTRQTAMMIAASETVEVISQTDTAKNLATDVTGLGRESIDLLRTYLQTTKQELLKDAADAVKEKVSDVAKDAKTTVTDAAKEAVTETIKEVAK